MRVSDSSPRNPVLIIRLHHLPESLDEISELEIISGRPVLVLIGGAGGIEEDDIPRINRAIAYLSRIANDTGAVIVDGGTDSGIMAAIGLARKNGNHSFPLVGVAVERLVTLPDSIIEADDGSPLSQNLTLLEPNHSVFVLVPGDDWGDESPYLARVGTLLARKSPSVSVLINGGQIARKDVSNNLNEGRPVIVMTGTGRFADELASSPPDSPGYHFVNANDYQKVGEVFYKMLGVA